jgi:hypothetical protein
MPDDGELVDNLSVIASDEDALHRILVQNPTELFDFPREAGTLSED